jgi:hypothetical protein
MMIVGRLVVGFIAFALFCKQVDSGGAAEACGFAKAIPDIHRQAFGTFSPL